MGTSNSLSQLTLPRMLGTVSMFPIRTWRHRSQQAWPEELTWGLDLPHLISHLPSRTLHFLCLGLG
jgi:hypothetical protein